MHDTASFVSNFLRSCCRLHLVRQLNRPSTQFSESRKDTCLYAPNDLNLSIYRCRSASDNPQAVIVRLQCINLSHNMAATERVEFIDVTAPYVSKQTWSGIGRWQIVPFCRAKKYILPPLLVCVHTVRAIYYYPCQFRLRLLH